MRYCSEIEEHTGIIVVSGNGLLTELGAKKGVSGTDTTTASTHLKFCGRWLLSIISHCVLILLSIFDPSSLVLISSKEIKTSFR